MQLSDVAQAGPMRVQVRLSMMKRIMQRIRNIAQIKSVRAWREACQKEALMKALDTAQTDQLMDELAQAKQGGALGMMG